MLLRFMVTVVPGRKKKSLKAIPEAEEDGPIAPPPMDDDDDEPLQPEDAEDFDRFIQSHAYLGVSRLLFSIDRVVKTNAALHLGRSLIWESPSFQLAAERT